MALPIRSSPLPPDVAVHGWGPITVRVAWTLLSLRVRPRPEVLRDARDHVLFYLDRATPLTRAEDLAAHLTRGFVARARQQPWDDPWPQDIEMALSNRWRVALDEALRPLSAQVFRQHYGYGRGFSALEGRLGVDRIALEEARGGLREVVRRIACADDVPLHDWPAERIDRLLARLAAFSVHDSPPLDEVAEGCHQAWTTRCPRCDRTDRLVRAGVLTSEDLIPPRLGARPSDRVRVLAIHLHPEGRRHRDVLRREMGGHAWPLGDDLLLVDDEPDGRTLDVLRLACEVGAPPRHQVRAVRLEGPGRWSDHGLLGPVADQARRALRAQPWGSVAGDEELPEVIPEPPSARRWWTAVGALAVLTLLAAGVALQPPPTPVDHPLEAVFTPGRGGVWVQFDTDGAAHVAVVRQGPEGLALVPGSGDPAAKAAWATGGGDYRLHTLADGVLVMTSAGPVPDLPALLEAADTGPEPLLRLERSVRDAVPGAALARWP